MNYSDQKPKRVSSKRRVQPKEARDLGRMFKHIQDYYEKQGKEVINITDLPLSNKFFLTVLRTINLAYDYGDGSSLAPEQKRFVDDLFAGMRAKTASNRVNFKIIKHLSQELGISMQIILYGTEDKKEIAKYDYEKYNTMGKIYRRFLTYQFNEYGNLARLINRKIMPVYQVREVAEAAGVSYEMIRIYSKPRSEAEKEEHKYYSIPRDVKVLERLCELADVNILDLFEFPIEHITDSQLFD